MIVFKNYFKIVKKHLGLIIFFSAISIGIAVANTSYNAENSYVNVESTVAVINHDESKLSQNFVEYLEKNTKMVEVNDDKKEIQDALYNNKADAILIIPNNYGTDLLEGKTPEIEIKKSTQNFSESIELLANKYFKIASIYSQIGMNEDEIIQNITENLNKEVSAKVTSENNSNKLSKPAVFFSFENYAFLSVFIFIVGTIMCIFNKETISKRNTVSKMKPQNFSLQLFMGHSALTLTIWGIFTVISFILYKDAMLTTNGLLFIVNSLVFAITITSLAYLIGTLIKKQNIISGVQNVFGLGLSFISGCFVPVDLLDKNIVNFAKIFPPYWFIDANYKIAKLSEFDFESLKPILQNMGIVAVFGIVYFAISRIFIKIKSKE